MDFLFRQHYSLRPAREVESNQAPLVLLLEPEAEALALYARHLTQANFSVNVCLELPRLLKVVQESQPQLLIINPSSDIVLALALLRQVADRHPGLPMITIGGAIPDLYLDRLMANGVALHLNRSLTQPRDIAVAARQLLGLN